MTEVLPMTIEETEKADRGTDIIMYIDDDCKEFLGKEQVFRSLLRKYCRFLPVPVAFGKKNGMERRQAGGHGRGQRHQQTSPRYGPRNRADLKDEDYKEFYRELYPMSGRASVLDSSERGLSVQPDGRALFPQNQEQHRTCNVTRFSCTATRCT